jgi:translation initiation factor 1
LETCSHSVRRKLTSVLIASLSISFSSFCFADAFADAAQVNDTGDIQLDQGHVHIRIQQRNGRKSITTVTGLSKALDLKRILKAIKKEYCCNGTVLKDDETGTEVLQFQGDQREPVKLFLLKEEICEKEHIKVHGF